MPKLPQLTPIASQPLSVILLARDQANQLDAILSAWVTFLNGLDRDYEVIVVDDGSSDGSGELAETLAGKYRRVQVRRHEQPLGEGMALRTALSLARYPLVFYVKCDPHYQPADLGKLLRKQADPARPELEIDHVHIMSAARGGRPAPWPWRLLGIFWRMVCRVLFTQAPDRLPGWLGWKRHLGALLVRILFGVRYDDVACPFRLLRRDIFTRIPLQSAGAFVHVEILAKAEYLGMIMGAEVPLEPGHYPPLTREMSRDEWQQLQDDARRVIRHPDFTPPSIHAAAPSLFA